LEVLERECVRGKKKEQMFRDCQVETLAVSDKSAAKKGLLKQCIFFLLKEQSQRIIDEG